MKKNKMMRIASVLLVATLLSTCVISGTFAKYVTSGSAADTARVAKFGVYISAEGELFSTTYVDVANGNTPGTANLTVVSSDTDKVVAPGTKSSDDGLQFGITGTPEVNVKVTIAVNDYSDIFLEEASSGKQYRNFTTATKDDYFDLAARYYPVKFTLTQGGTTIVDGGTLWDVNQYFTVNFTDKEYAANTDLSTAIGDFKLTWEWAFQNTGVVNAASENVVDLADTLLGDIAADTFPTGEGNWFYDGSAWTTGTADTDYCLEAALDFTITVTQID